MHTTSENKAAKEVKGVVDKPPATRSKSEGGGMGKSTDDQKTSVKAGEEEPKGFPHQQVPQPGDFSSEALEQL